MAGSDSTQTTLVGIMHRQDASLHSSSNRVSLKTCVGMHVMCALSLVLFVAISTY